MIRRHHKKKKARAARTLLVTTLFVKRSHTGAFIVEPLLYGWRASTTEDLTGQHLRIRMHSKIVVQYWFPCLLSFDACYVR